MVLNPPDATLFPTATSITTSAGASDVHLFGRQNETIGRARANPGDVCELPLGDGRYAYGRVLRDASIAVYRTVSHRAGSPPLGEREFLFTVGIYEDVPGSANAPIVGHDPFSSEDESWPPPYKVVDPIDGRVQLYHRGAMRGTVDPGEASHLEKAAVWDLHHLTQRIREALPV